jgi:hypothetical protein
MKYSHSFLLLIVFCVGIFPVTAQKKKSEQALKDWSAYDFKIHYDPKVYGGKKTILENKRVFVNDFVVSQVVLANGKQMGTSSFAKMSVSMSPLDVKAYNDLVNSLYNQFIEDLKAQGFEIVPDKEVEASDFVKEANERKNVYAWYTDDKPLQDADQFGSETMRFRPTNKYVVVNGAKIIGTFNTRFSKAINAQLLSMNLVINFVTFDGSRRSGYKGGASIEAFPYLAVYPYAYFLNERGGINFPSPGGVEANPNWIGEKGIEKVSSSTTVFGSAKGTYVMDINEPVYMTEISAITKGLVKEFTDSVKKELE